MEGKCGEVETLVVRIGLFDIAHMPFADVHGAIASLGEDLGQRDLLGGESFTRKGGFGLVHAGP